MYAPTHVNRPDGTGWNIGVPYLTENPYEQFANGLKVQVLSDGVLSTTGTLELDELTIDATDAGAIESFAFAQNGVLNLVNVSSSMMLPGTYAGCSVIVSNGALIPTIPISPAPIALRISSGKVGRTVLRAKRKEYLSELQSVGVLNTFVIA